MSSSQTSSSSTNPASPAAEASDPEVPFPGLMDVACRVVVRLGSGSIRVEDCLALRPQSVLRLAAPAGADLDVLVQDVVIARGEVAIVDDATSIRLTEVPAAADEVTP